MADSVNITVKNLSGSSQDYALFADYPTILHGTVGAMWSNIMNAAPDTPVNGHASFNVSTQFLAICGMFKGQPESGGQLIITKTVPVNLGRYGRDDWMPGSTVGLVVRNQRTCDFKASDSPGAGVFGAFMLDTSTTPENTFTLVDSSKNNLLVGIATSGDTDAGTAVATFSPMPNIQYQIAPKAKFFVSFDQKFEAGQLVKIEMVGSKFAVDFQARQSNHVTIEHREDGRMYFV